MLSAGISDDGSVPIRKETRGWQVASCSSNVSEVGVNLGGSRIIDMLVSFVWIVNNNKGVGQRYKESNL